MNNRSDWMVMIVVTAVIIGAVFYMDNFSKERDHLKVVAEKTLNQELKSQREAKLRILETPSEDVFYESNDTWRVTDGKTVWDVTMKEVNSHYNIKRVIKVGTLEKGGNAS